MKKYICELLGTFVLVLFGCGTACIPGVLYGFSSVITPLAFGFSIIALAFAIGNISGCHVNPAVSFAMFLDRRLSAKDLIGYIVAQFIGAIAAAAILLYFMNESSIVSQYGLAQFGLGANGFDEASNFGIGMIPAIITEIILTFVFVLAVLGSTANKKTANFAGIIIGLTLAFVHILGIPLTGTSVNPARSFGPALMMLVGTGEATALSQVWVFIVSPLLGATLAAGFWKFISTEKEIESTKKTDFVSEEADSKPDYQLKSENEEIKTEDKKEEIKVAENSNNDTSNKEEKTNTEN